MIENGTYFEQLKPSIFPGVRSQWVVCDVITVIVLPGLYFSHYNHLKDLFLKPYTFGMLSYSCPVSLLLRISVVDILFSSVLYDFSKRNTKASSTKSLLWSHSLCYCQMHFPKKLLSLPNKMIWGCSFDLMQKVAGSFINQSSSATVVSL